MHLEKRNVFPNHQLVVLTDNIGFVELYADFFAFIVNEEVQTAIVFQDSTSVISLVTKGGGIIRKKHLHARMNLRKEAVGEKRIKVLYKMLTDGLTKILEGKDYIFLAEKLLGNLAE